MATTGKVKGNSIGIYVGGSLIACATNANLDLSYESIDATCKDNDGQKQVLLGQKGMTFSCDGLIQYDATYGVEDLQAVFNAGTAVTVMWSTEVTGDYRYSASCYMMSLSETGGLNEVGTWSATFESDGAITYDQAS